MIELQLAGPFVPYTRMTQGSKWSDRARRYLASQDALRLQMRSLMAACDAEMIGRGRPLSVRIAIYGTDHRCDLDNQVKALLDAAQSVVFEDDRWIDRIEARRAGGDASGVMLAIKEI